MAVETIVGVMTTRPGPRVGHVGRVRIDCGDCGVVSDVQAADEEYMTPKRVAFLQEMAEEHDREIHDGQGRVRLKQHILTPPGRKRRPPGRCFLAHCEL